MSRTSLTAAVLTLCLGLAHMVHAADEPAKPNTLAKEQIAAGWILLFDGQTPFGWTIEGGGKVENGMLVIGGEKDTTARTNSEFASLQLDFEYGGDCKGAQLLLNDQKLELPASDHPDPAKRWMHGMVALTAARQKYSLAAAFNPPGSVVERMPARNLDGRSRTHIGFHVPSGSTLLLRNVRLNPTNMMVLFNGKDLTGWKVIPGHASKFSVTDKGEMNIRNGGGEIQTEGQWADFVLRLDVFSNGEHLNSGVFFRAIPGEFWQGYEAQIRNEWKGYKGGEPRDEKNEDRTKPHDFGTGGIYNRQPSRKVVSNDKEWFTYTILANGNHIATWVDGYQAADYFDNDKDAETARKGRYLGKGVISLQGHDPTTDLSFRNIKLQELPEKK